MSESNTSGDPAPSPTATRGGPARAIVMEEAESALNPSDKTFWIGFTVVALSVVSALASYLILTGLTPITPRNEVVWAALALNSVLILASLAIIIWQAIGLRRAWRQRTPGARLHTRIVVLFSIISALPAILLAVAATTTFSRSLDGWFSTRTRTIIENSYDVARAYVEEHGQIIRTDITNMVRDIDGSADQLRDDADALQKFLIGQAGLRDLTSAYIIDGDGVPIILALDDAKIPYTVPSLSVIRQAEAGQVALSDPTAEDYRVFAVAKLNSMPGRFLYVARGISPKVIGHLQRTEQNADEYNRLRRSKGGLKFAHGLIYFMISTTALLAAIWAGMWFAGRFVAPIRRLIAGAEEVSKGNLAFSLPEKRGEGDLRRLSETFNEMTRELKVQQDALVSTNALLTERRNFMEAVLSGVSAGVIGLDSNAKVTLLSRSAERLLGVTSESAIGKSLGDIVPEFEPLLDAETDSSVKPRTQFEIKKQVGDDERTFAVRITRERGGEGDVGLVVTFDDVSDLVQAQRTSAWADVARRIAHEIKNPLTPIQLSAERLRNKFGKQVLENRELFDTLTQTIERQTGQIKSMVDEFASFARMPQPVMMDQDLRLAVQEPGVLFREGNKDIDFRLVIPSHPVRARFDLRLISQAVTNLIKNATEAIEGFTEAQGRPADYRGEIEVRLSEEANRVTIDVIDNGVGLPKQNRARLLEPYVTTRAKGTGLGLAIVHKVVEQHGGTLSLEDAPLTATRTRGAMVRMTLPARSAAEALGSSDTQTDTEPKARAGVRA